MVAPPADEGRRLRTANERSLKMTPTRPHSGPHFFLFFPLLSGTVVIELAGVISMDILGIPAFVKSALLALHLSGIVLGLGAATMLDLIIVRFVGSRAVTHEYWSVISLLSKAVTGGLILLWTSGIGFLTHYMFFNPTLLTNPKIWAKITIVGVLSLNGVFIHRVVLPLVRRQVGRPLFEGLTDFQRSCLLASGAISGMSWWIPLGLGAFPQLNFTVGAGTILAIYALLLVLATVLASLIVRHALPQLTTITLPRAEYDDLVDRLRTLKRAADVLATGVSGRADEMGHGPMTAGRDRTQPNAPSKKRPGFVRTAWSRAALPAMAALLAVGLVYLFRPPVHPAPSPSEHPDTSAGFQLSSTAGPSLEQGAAHLGQPAAELPHWTASIYEPPQHTTPESQPGPGPQSEGSARTVRDEDDERLPPRAPAKAAFVGLWGADADACSAKPQSLSNPRATISETGATAGEIVCSFERMRFDGSGWQAMARCFNGRERWTSTVRLTVNGDRLTWTSQRGSATYQRCERATTFTTAQRR